MAYQRPKEGEPLSASALNEVPNQLKDLVNGDESGKERVRNALRRDHLPSLIDAGYDGTGEGAVHGLSMMGKGAGGGFGPGGVQYYSYIERVDDPDWQAFNMNGTGAPYGPAPNTTALNDYGWRIPMEPSIDYAAERHLGDEGTGTPYRSLEDESILVNFSLDLWDIGVYSGEGSGDTLVAFVAIGITLANLGSGNRYILERTIRGFDRDSYKNGDIGTFTLVTEADLVAAGEALQVANPRLATVFGVIAAVRGVGTNSFNINGGVRIGNYNIDALPVPKGGF